MNLSVIFHGDWEVYAHRDPVSGKRELLQEHIARCEKYRIRISQERKLLKIEENFLTKLGLDKDDFAGKLVKEMIDAVILFHDLGKGTPAFQKNKMGNPNTIPTKYWGDDSSHSFLSAFLYLDFYLYEIKNGFNKVEKEQKKALIALAWELSYVIAKHHSNFESMEAYLKNFQLKAEELQRKWKEEPVPGFSQLRYFYEIPIAKSINQYFMCRKAFGRTENDIVHYFFIRLEYSILVACDYYATTEFNSGFEMDCFGKADASKFREIYERSHLMESIRKYGKELDEVTGPVYVHTDTWDGNLLIKNGKLTGLIDYAAVLWADPLLSHDFHDFGDVPNPYFLQGYGKIEFTQNEKIRIQIYRIWQRLGMVVERGYREYEDPHMYDWVLDDFAREVEKLETAVMDHN